MKWVVYILIVLYCVSVCFSLSDPYRVLGIHKSATAPEIRKAYKQLAKEWHPDKNNDPGAEDKFVEITQAYELLSDPERRKQYDNFGRIIEETRPRPDYRRFDPMDDLFAGTGFRFRYPDRDITLFHKLSISTRSFENVLVPKSYRTPHLLLFYSDWCFACLQVEPVWRRVMEELEPIGVGIATVHTENEPMLSRRVGVHSLPCLAILIDGKTSVFKESLFSVQKIVEFVRYKMPYRMVTQITDDTVQDFLSGWVDNKVRALLFQKNEPIRLRYLLTVFYHRDRVAFGFVQMSSSSTEGIRMKYQVQRDMDSLLLFNENVDRPMARISMSDIPVQTMQDVINKNKYLLLPRLSSQAMLDALCPAGWSRPRKRLCVLLVSQNTPYHDEHRQSLRRFAQESNYTPDRVRFMYVFQERQADFVHALTAGSGSPAEPLLHVVILWRRDTNHIKYEWLSGETDWTASYNETKERLEAAIERILHATQALPHEAVVSELIDEHAQGVFMKFFNKILLTYDSMRDSLGKEHVLPAISVVATIAIILAAGYIMTYLMKLEETRVQEECSGSKESKNCNGKPSVPQPPQQQLKLHEMRAETFNGLVRLLKPGCRTILLLVDTQSRTKLLPKFHKIVWPYRKNKTLLFAHLNLDRGLSWYTQLLTLSLPEPRDLKINPRNCIGTVLSLNGLRKYFCMYHAKHPECIGTKGSKRMARMTKSMGSNSSNVFGSFMGFEDSVSEDSDDSDIEQGSRIEQNGGDRYSQVIFQENLLDGLPNWLDRLFEGTTHRYYINYWPDFTGK